MRGSRARRLWWLWLLLGVLVVLIAFALIVAIPILTHQDQGLSHQEPAAGEWPDSVSAVGDDGRTRAISVVGEDGEPLDTSALSAGDRVIVSGSGFDAGRGIYVAICVIPDSSDVKPGPCIGGSPQQTQDPAANAGAVQYAASNWINEDWAWRMFGARSYDSAADGTFTAYLVVGEPVGDGFDCRVERCGIVTRNDHTAASDRVQDVYLPVRYSG